MKVEIMIPVRIASLALDSGSNQPVIVLRPIDDTPGQGRLLPIWIGHPEATSILLALEDVELPRPLTHDLIKNMLEALEATIDRVDIVAFEEGTFFATITLDTPTGALAVDARPSDSVALAVRSNAPIFVSEQVLNAASIPEEADREIDEEAEVDQFRHFLDTVDPEDFKF